MKKMPSENDDKLKSFIYNILVLLGIGLGIAVRSLHLFRVPLEAPFRLGGLFYEFSQQILANNYALPQNIPFYSQSGIPFAYPPLGFYVQALIIDVFSPPPFWTVNFLPPLVAMLCVPSFYFLLRSVIASKKIIIGALFAYALIPSAFINQIEAAGLAESFGTLALIWYAYFLIKVEKKQRIIDIFLAGLFLTVSIISSPGSALGVVVFSLLFVGELLINRHYKLVGKMVGVGLIGFIISAPYWATVILNHGIEIFSAPISGQFNGVENVSFIARFLESFFEFNYAGGDYAFIWNILILMGLFWYLFKENWFLPILFFILALIPRESVWLIALVTPLLIGVGISKFALPHLDRGFKGFSKKSIRLFMFTAIALAVISTLTLNAILAIEELVSDEEWLISAAQIEDIEALSKEMPQDAQILVVGNEGILEWAPQIIQREVINTPYGLEWQPDELVVVMEINKVLEEGESWNEILVILQEEMGIESVYLLSDKSYISNLNENNVGLIKIAETPLFILEVLSR